MWAMLKDIYLLELARHIVLKPVRAKVAKRVECRPDRMEALIF